MNTKFVTLTFLHSVNGEFQRNVDKSMIQFNNRIMSQKVDGQVEDNLTIWIDGEILLQRQSATFIHSGRFTKDWRFAFYTLSGLTPVQPFSFHIWNHLQLQHLHTESYLTRNA